METLMALVTPLEPQLEHCCSEHWQLVMAIQVILMAHETRLEV